MPATLKTTITPVLNGTDTAAGVGSIWQFAFTSPGAWTVGDMFYVNVRISASGLDYNFGAGPASKKTPSFLLTHDQKLNFLNGTSWFFSAVGEPTKLNGLSSAGNALINIANSFAIPENLMALAPYQGKMAVFGKNCIQIWTVGASPTEYALQQTLANVGTIARLSVHPLGELDIFFLDETGIRTLRTKDSTLNAYPDDVGSPIDLLVQAKIAAATATERAAACGIFDPTTSRYWLFLKDTIYTFSQFQSAKITAWSEYKPTYQTADVSPLTFTNGAVPSVYIKLGMVNDVSKAEQVFTVGGLATQADIKPANYLWVYASSSDALLVSHTITDGIKFRGNLALNAIGTTVTETSNQTAFTPQKFLTRNKRVFARTATGLVAYGGATGAVYDNAVGYWQTPWLDAESADKSKFDDGINASMKEAWYIYASADYQTEQFTEVLAAQSVATYDGGKIPFSSVGTHYAMAGVSNVAARAVFSAISISFK